MDGKKLQSQVNSFHHLSLSRDLPLQEIPFALSAAAGHDETWTSWLCPDSAAAVQHVVVASLAGYHLKWHIFCWSTGVMHLPDQREAL